MAYAICMAESRGNTEAYHINLNGSVDRGLMEINSVHSNLINGDVLSLYNPQINVEVAYKIYCQQGWGAWQTYINGQYLNFM